jgi:hypothetical protein
MGISIRQAAKQCGVKHQCLLKAIKAGSLHKEADGTIELSKLRTSEWYNAHIGRKGMSPTSAAIAPKDDEDPFAAVPQSEAEKPIEVRAPEKAERALPVNSEAERKAKLRKVLGVDNDDALNLIANDKIFLEKLLILERREAIRLDNEERRGKLVKNEEVSAQWQRIASELKGRLLLFPGSLSAKLVNISDAREVQRILEIEVREALTVLSRMKIDAA